MEFDIGEKYRQMKRSHKKLVGIGTDTGGNISNVEAKDAAEDFFAQCYHFKDWLKKKYPNLESDVEQHINGSIALSVSADFCNTFKHAGLDKRPRTGEDLAHINTHIKMDYTPNGIISASHITISTSSRTFDALDIASQCIDDWDSFLRNNSIIISQP